MGRSGIWSGLLACLASAVPMFATGVTYTCGSNVDAGICTTLNTSIAGLYSSTFLNANADIFIQFGPSGLASTLQYSTNVTYKAYVDALTAAENDGNDATAVASLGGDINNPVVSGDGVALTSALATVLGLANVADSLGITAVGSNSCVLGNSGCYNGQITVSNAPNTFYFRSGAQGSGTYDFYTAVEHETDEILGTPSCIVGDTGNGVPIGTSVNCTNGLGGNPGTGLSAADLFRYSAAHARSYLVSANSTLAYFSIDGGATDIANYNNSPNGEDYGDWDAAAARVQNAVGSPNVSGVDITNDGRSEILVLDAVGYTVAPEPGTVGMMGGALVFFFLIVRRRRQILQ